MNDFSFSPIFRLCTEPMPCRISAQPDPDDIGLGPDDSDPRWDAYQSCREDASVMSDALGAESFMDMWSELHSVIQEPLEKGVGPETARSAKLARIECVFEKWLDHAAMAKLAGEEWLARDPWGQE